uniref:RHS repeat-associated core domain-containing protein n=1 Tax=Streptomyces sp. PU-14G TaxID=2800808 RepID=UPI0034DF257A
PPDTTTCPLRFPGQYADPETDLHYNYFRFYDPETARYLSPDPLGLGPGPNPHTYVSNSLYLIDPLGLAPACIPGPRIRKPGNEVVPYNPALANRQKMGNTCQSWRPRRGERFHGTQRKG